MPVIRLDEGESVFFARQLEHLKSRSYDIKFARLKARTLIPVSFEAGPGAESIRYEQFDMVGVAKVISNYATDLPRADVKAREFLSPIKSLGASFGYNIQEIRAAAKAGKPLNSRKADAARRAVSQQENSVALFGDTDHNLPGFFTNANIPDVVLPGDGTASATTFASKTPDKVIRDLNSISNTVLTQSNGVEEPNTMLLPLAQFTLINSTPRSSDSDTTVMKYYLMNNGFVSQMDWVNELAAANGPLSADTAICYRRDPEVLTLEIPQDYEMMPPQSEGLDEVVPVHQRIGGTIIYYPLAMTKSDDV